MRKDTKLNDKMNVEAVTDSNFPAYSFGRVIAENVSALFRKSSAWAAARLDAHYERLASLRVYDHRRN